MRSRKEIIQLREKKMYPEAVVAALELWRSEPTAENEQLLRQLQMLSPQVLWVTPSLTVLDPPVCLITSPCQQWAAMASRELLMTPLILVRRFGEEPHFEYYSLDEDFAELSFDSTSQYLLVTQHNGDQKRIRLESASTWEASSELRRSPSKETMKLIRSSEDGKVKLAAGTDPELLKLMNLLRKNREDLKTLPYKSKLWGEVDLECEWESMFGFYSLAVSPGGRYLVAGPESFVDPLVCWDLKTGRVIFEENISFDEVLVEFIDHENFALTASSCRSVTFWNVHSGEEIFPIPGHQNEVNKICISLDFSLIATVGDDSRVRIWDLLSGEQLFVFRASNFGAVAFSPDSKKVFFENHLAVWSADLRVGTLQVEVEAEKRSTFFDNTTEFLACVNGVELPDQVGLSEPGMAFNTHLLLCNATDSPVLAYVGPGDPREVIILYGKSYSQRKVFSFEAKIKGLCLSAGGDFLAVSFQGETAYVRVLEVEFEKEYAQFEIKTISGVELNKEGTLLASFGEYTGDIHLYSVKTGQLKSVVSGHFDGVNSVAFSADSSLLASASDDHTARLWRIGAVDQNTDFKTNKTGLERRSDGKVGTITVPGSAYAGTFIGEFCSGP